MEVQSFLKFDVHYHGYCDHRAMQQMNDADSLFLLEFPWCYRQTSKLAKRPMGKQCHQRKSLNQEHRRSQAFLQGLASME
jgi:hypothetical protein